jgi:hypothetical protein
MSRTLVLAVFLAAWLATGIFTGVVMGRRYDRFLDRSLWWLLGAASGALMVPLALGTERREKPIGRASSPQSSQDRAVPVVVRIDDAREVAAAVIAGLDRHDRKAG